MANDFHNRDDDSDITETDKVVQELSAELRGYIDEPLANVLADAINEFIQQGNKLSPNGLMATLVYMAAAEAVRTYGGGLTVESEAHICTFSLALEEMMHDVAHDLCNIKRRQEAGETIEQMEAEVDARKRKMN